MPDLSRIVLAREAGERGEGRSISEAVAVYAGEQLPLPFDRPRSASPVVMEWMSNWAAKLDDTDRQELRRYIPSLANSRGTAEQEAARAWLVVDWLVRTNAPLWLVGAHLRDQAEALGELHPIRGPDDYAQVTPAVGDVRATARQRSEQSWLDVADDALVGVVAAQPQQRRIVVDLDLQPLDQTRRSRLEAWAAVADITTAALEALATLVDCATNAVDMGCRAGEVPDHLESIAQAIGHAATAIAWTAVRGLTTSTDWSWESASADAPQIVFAVVRAAFQPIEQEVRRSGHDLVSGLL